ncbi:MAG: glycerol-3-phosphate 1-O-acyltransferase PlsY [Bacteroidota bacterium]
MSLSLALLFGSAYLLGAIPFSLVVARLRGVDLRRHGSGNAGATNAMRVLGKGPGALVFALDFFKGLLATVVLPTTLLGAAAPEWTMVAAGATAMIGHVFTVWGALFFGGWKGGKGVATGAGMLTGLVPVAVLAGLIVFVSTVALSRMVSLGSILAATTIPIALGAQSLLYPSTTPGRAIWIFAIAVPLFILWTHRSNVQRLLDGTEAKVTDTA